MYLHMHRHVYVCLCEHVYLFVYVTVCAHGCVYAQGQPKDVSKVFLLFPHSILKLFFLPFPAICSMQFQLLKTIKCLRGIKH